MQPHLLYSFIWLGMFAGLILIEALTTNFVSIWFAIGAVAALLTSLVSDNFTLQFCVFTAVSTLAIFITLPMVRELRAKKSEPTCADRNIGRIAIVLEPITPGTRGRVKLDGVEWFAVCETPLEEHAQCMVEAIHSTVLTVAPVAVNTHSS